RGGGPGSHRPLPRGGHHAAYPGPGRGPCRGGRLRADDRGSGGLSAFAGLLLVSFSVGLSNFAGAIGIGLSGVDARTRLRVGIAFGLFEGLMPVLGLAIGQALAGTLGSYGRYLGAGLLVLTGAYTIWQARRTG